MRFPICVFAVVLCLAAIAAARPAAAGVFARHNGDPAQTSAGPSADCDCADGQCDARRHQKQGEPDKHLRKKIDVDVNVNVNTATPAETKPAAKPAAPEVSDGEKAALVVCAMLLAGGIAAVVQFRSRVAGSRKSGG